MMPTLAQRVCPSTATWASGAARARRSSASSATAARSAPGVVAELSDLGRGLVDERQAAVDPRARTRSGTADRPALGHQPGDRRVGHVEPVVPHEQVEPGGVAAPDLEPVDRRQCPLNGEVAGHRTDRRVATGEHETSRAVRSRSWRIAHVASRSATSVALAASIVVGADDPDTRSGHRLVGECLELVEPALDPRHQLVMVGEREQAGQPAQSSVDGLDSRRDRAHVGPRREGGIEPGDDLVSGRDRERGRAAHDADDAAHGVPGY